MIPVNAQEEGRDPAKLASTDYPTTRGVFDRIYNGGFTDAFVTKLPTG